MLGRQEKTALLILLGVAVIVLAAHGALTVNGKGPFATVFSNHSADGDLVILQGTVNQVSMTKNGGHVILSVNNQTVFVPSQAAQGHSFRKGQNVSLFGTVETYRGEKEVVVNSATDIREI